MQNTGSATIDFLKIRDNSLRYIATLASCPRSSYCSYSSSIPVKLMSTAMGTVQAKGEGPPTFSAGEAPLKKVTYTEEELKSRLSAEQYQVTQNKGQLHHLAELSADLELSPSIFKME